MARFDVALDLWHAFRCDLIPHDPSGALVEAVDVPGMPGQVGVGSHIAIKAVPKILVALAADGGGDEHPVSPHDGARVSQPWYGRLPNYVCAFGRIPVCWGRLAVGDPRSIRTAKRRPVFRICKSRNGKQENNKVITFHLTPRGNSTISGTAQTIPGLQAGERRTDC